MTEPGRTSLVIVSRGRTGMLERCLAAVMQQDHPAFEVVVVADPEAAVAVRAQGLPVKLATCAEPGIAIARNIGIGLAAGEIVAFLDDDAVPEPTWLSRLAAAYDDPDVAAAGGVVRGRNGISLQWAGGTVDRLTRPGRLDAPRGVISLHRGRPGLAIEIKGCNCSYRRDVLVRLGGFDPALDYYLDETELNLRLAHHGLVTAFVPLAQVHHAKAASPRRDGDLTPRSLHDVGASTAMVLRRHGASEIERASVLAWLEDDRRRQLLEMMVDGRIEPRDVRRLLATLAEGWHAGSVRRLPPTARIATEPEAPFRRFLAGAREGRVIAGMSWRAKRVRAAARAEVDAGRIATAILLTPTPMAHRMEFRPEGYWLQRGGLFGRSDRSGPLLRPWRFGPRVRQETRRIAPFRPVGPSAPGIRR